MWIGGVGSLEESTLKKGDIVYYGRVVPNNDIYDVLELKIRTVEDTWFVGTEKATKHAYLFGFTNLGKYVFKDRKDALAYVKEAEKHRVKVSQEIYYEED